MTDRASSKARITLRASVRAAGVSVGRAVMSYGHGGHFLSLDVRNYSYIYGMHSSCKRQVKPFGKIAIVNNPLDSLQNCADVNSLRLGLRSLCARFGSIAQLDILTARQAGKLQAICFLRMDSPAQEQQVMSELGIGRFGGDLVVVVDLQTSGLRLP